jgi:hypothetical protein
MVECPFSRLAAAGIEHHRHIIEVLPVNGQANDQVGAVAVQPLLLFVYRLPQKAAVNRR